MQVFETHNLTVNQRKILYSHDPTDPSGRGCIAEIIERDEYRLSRFVGLKGEVLLDIGANNGLVTLILASQNPDSRIISLEPSPRLAEVIRHNIAQNGLENVVFVNKALDEQLGETELFLATSCSGASSTSVKDVMSFAAFEGPPQSVRVPTTTFDELVEQFSLDRIAYLKIDCEGGEYSLLRSVHFRRGIVRSLGGEFHQTSYGASSSTAADELILFCQQHVTGDIYLTVLDRFPGRIQERRFARSI